jgi:hypothetical protein
MIFDRDLWAAALAMVKRYGNDAIIEAVARADQLVEDDDIASTVTWHRIIDCIER